MCLGQGLLNTKYMYFHSCPCVFLFLTAGSELPPPVIRQGPVNQTVPVDSTVVLNCHTASMPPPLVHWKKDGVVLSPVDTRLSIAESGSLEIRHTKVQHRGGRVI